MASGRSSRISLGPGDALAIRQSKAGQVWDPTIGTFRSMDAVLSKDSISETSSEGRPTTPISGRSSISSLISTNSSLRSTPSSHTTYSSTKGSAAHQAQPKHHRIAHSSTVNTRLPFQKLPSEIYVCILRQLRKIHGRPSLRSCQTCYLRDLCALSLTSRAWDRCVVRQMYERIEIVGHDSKDQMKKHKIKHGVRLKLLRRTLRGRSFLAQHVRELKVPALHTGGDSISAETEDLVASVIMACPNLERLDGFYPVYRHEFNKIAHALSTRQQLKEQLWLIGENAAITQRSHKQLAPGLMDPEQKAQFVHYHSNWLNLATLFLFSPAQGILERDVFVNAKNELDPLKVRGPGILHRLPSLKHLCIANFDMDDFDDLTLQHLPPLQSLRLEELEGVTFWGLSEFSRTRNALSIQNLALVNLDITYISAISNLLLHLKHLKRFTLVQDTSPEITPGEIVIQPIIASTQLEYLHWDIVVPGSAHDNLISSIRAEGFPRLRTIRAPSDHYGQIQALCRPRAGITLPGDTDGRAPVTKGVSQGGLREARIAAQGRLEDAWCTVQFKIVVEEAGIVREIYDLNGFMGTIGSQIHYCLEPDVEGSDQALIDFADVVGGREEGAGKGGNVCRGAWNATHPAGVKWWQHTPRPRYNSIDLLKFF